MLDIINYGCGGGSNRLRGHGGFHGRGRGRQSRDQVECYKCHKVGHYKGECQHGVNMMPTLMNTIKVKNCVLWHNMKQPQKSKVKFSFLT